MSFESLFSILSRESLKELRQKSTQNLDESLSTSFRRLDTEKNNLTDEQISKITEQIANKIAKNLKDEIWRTKITFSKALSSLSKNSPYGDITSVSAETTPKKKSISLG